MTSIKSMETVAYSGIPIVFTHYGFSEYLSYTLKAAKATNPGKRLIFIGDSSNLDVAKDAGWDHYDLSSLKSPKRDHFNSVFRWVQGPKHNPVKGNKDWLRYVFERFYILEQLCKQENITAFWHFDSDTMILHDLTQYEDKLIRSPLSCTTQCNDSCPSGFISASFISLFCDSIIEDFTNTPYLAAQELEFTESHPYYAFTEMRAFQHLRSKLTLSLASLSSISKDNLVWFDDCACQQHIFLTRFSIGAWSRVKAYYHSDDSIFCTSYDGNTYTFASINLSWLPLKAFDWVYKAAVTSKPCSTSLHSHLGVLPTEKLLRRLKIFTSSNR